MTENETVEVRHQLAVRITVDAFRIGAGALLFLLAVSLVDSKLQIPASKRSILDLAVVPLVIPVTSTQGESNV